MRTIISSNTCDTSTYFILDYFNLDLKLKHNFICIEFIMNQIVNTGFR